MESKQNVKAKTKCPQEGTHNDPFDGSDSEEENIDEPFSNKKGKQIRNPSKAVPSKRGRKAIPAQWSRIIDLQELSGGAP